MGEIYDWKEMIVVFCNTGKETPETLDFIQKIQLQIPIPIAWLEYTTANKRGYKVVNFETASRNGEPFTELIKKYKDLPNLRNRSCTGKLKIETTRKYLVDLGIKLQDRDQYLGIRYDEPLRYFKRKDEAFMPLYEWKVTKAQVLDFWKNYHFDLVDSLFGSNCDLCFHKPLAQIIRALRINPNAAAWWINAENKKGGKCFRQDKVFVEDILHISKTQITINLSETETSIGCFCGD